MDTTGWLLRVLPVTVILTILFSTIVFAQNQGIVNGTNVNVRSGNSLEAPIVSQLHTGQAVDVLSKEGDFYKITGNGIDTGYVYSEFINILFAEGIFSGDSVNIRKSPSMQGSIIAQGYAGEKVEITGLTGDFYIIDYKGQEAFVSKDYILGQVTDFVTVRNVVAVESAPPVQVAMVTNTVSQQLTDVFGIVNSSNGLNFRQGPSLDAEILLTLPPNALVDVTELNGEWIRSSYDGYEGYLFAEFITLHTGQKPEESKIVGSRAQEIISYGKRFLGTPYKYAGTSLNSGVDCSGFVYSVMKHFGISLNRSSRDMSKNGYAVSKSDLQMGDLIFFDTNGGTNNGNISHVGIYISDGQFIHSSSSSRNWGVTISSLQEDYYTRNYVMASRVIN